MSRLTKRMPTEVRCILSPKSKWTKFTFFRRRKRQHFSFTDSMELSLALMFTFITYIVFWLRLRRSKFVCLKCKLKFCRSFIFHHFFLYRALVSESFVLNVVVVVTVVSVHSVVCACMFILPKCRKATKRIEFTAAHTQTNDKAISRPRSALSHCRPVHVLLCTRAPYVCLSAAFMCRPFLFRVPHISDIMTSSLG